MIGRLRYSRIGRKLTAVAVLAGFVGTMPAYGAPAESEVAVQRFEEIPGEAPGLPTGTGNILTGSLSGRDGEKGSAEVDRMNGKYFKGILFDTGKIITSPLRWDGGDWLKAGAVVGVTSALFLADSPVRDFAQRNQNSVADKFATVGNAFGDPLYAPVALSSFYLYGVLKDDAKARRASLLSLESGLIAGVFTLGLKSLVQRHRPVMGHDPGTMDGPGFGTENVSFSSGHTSTAFAMATVFADEYRDSKIVPPLAYGLATLTAAARVYDSEHWASDVFFGAALGYFTSKAILKLHQKADSRLTIMPQIGKQMAGVSVGYKF